VCKRTGKGAEGEVVIDVGLTRTQLPVLPAPKVQSLPEALVARQSLPLLIDRGHRRQLLKARPSGKPVKSQQAAQLAAGVVCNMSRRDEKEEKRKKS
jgi:hypothetical protein